MESASYYSTHKTYFKEYYKEYHLKHREKMIDNATQYNLDHVEQHKIACKRYLNKNKKDIYTRRNSKNRMKKVLRELLYRFQNDEFV